MRIIKTSEAVADIIDSAAFIAQDDLDAALRFVDAVDESLDLLARSPGLGPIKTFAEAGEFRMWIVKGFPNYLLFYKPSPTEIILVRLIHSARDYWRVMDKLP